jgi:hypothetical protein
MASKIPGVAHRLAAVSLNEPWADYSQIVLQMAILDTLLSIEEKLTALTSQGGLGSQTVEDQ